MRSPTSAPGHVLIVEQDDDLRDLYETFFSAHGYAVSAASSASKAIEYAKFEPDAIFCSLVFKDISGFDLCRHLRSLPQTANSLIVAITGYRVATTEREVQDAGFDQYLLKPAKLNTLLTLLRSRCPTVGVLASARV